MQVPHTDSSIDFCQNPAVSEVVCSQDPHQVCETAQWQAPNHGLIFSRRDLQAGLEQPTLVSAYDLIEHLIVVQLFPPLPL